MEITTGKLWEAPGSSGRLWEALGGFGRLWDVFLTRYVLKAWGSRPEAPKLIYEDIPYQICDESLRK